MPIRIKLDLPPAGGNGGSATRPPPSGLADFWRERMAGQAQRATSTRNRKSLAELRKENAKLKKQLNARERDLVEAVKEQAAVRDVLKVIIASVCAMPEAFN